MAALRDIKSKISGVKKTAQITRAMNMVAAAKLRNIQGKTEQFRPYSQKFAEVLADLKEGFKAGHLLLNEPAPDSVKTVALILLTADRGLCGAFNLNLINLAQKFIAQREALGQQVRLILIGRKGIDFYRRKNKPVMLALPGVMGSIDFELAAAIGRTSLEALYQEEVQEAHFIYSRFRSMASQVPTLERVLPITPPDMPEAQGRHGDYLIEPSAEAIMDTLLPRYLNVRIYQGLLETSTSENAARVAAMDNANRNCKEIIANLELVYNKARQSAITSELIDIVIGSEALKG